MATGQLTDVKVRNLKFSGKAVKYFDGGGLFLLVTGTGKYWRMADRFNCKQRMYSIGVHPTVSLVKTCKARDAERAQLWVGIDPANARRQAKKDRVVENASTERCGHCLYKQENSWKRTLFTIEWELK